MSLNIEPKIFRPVSLPEQFVGAPILPAVLNLIFFIVLFMVASLMEFPAPVIFIFGALIVHLLLIKLGAIEPHMTTILKSQPISRRKFKTFLSKKDLDLYP